MKTMLEIIQKHLKGQALVEEAHAELLEFDKLSDGPRMYQEGRASGFASARHFVDMMMDRVEEINDTLSETKIGENDE